MLSVELLDPHNGLTVGMRGCQCSVSRRGGMAGRSGREGEETTNYKVMPIGTSRTLLKLLLTASALSVVR